MTDLVTVTAPVRVIKRLGDSNDGIAGAVYFATVTQAGFKPCALHGERR